MKSKIWTVFILIIFINICVINCDNNADKERDNAITLAGIILALTSSSLTQYTPNQANWDTLYTKATAGGTNKSHDPDGVGWLTASSWENAKWDGTVYNPNNLTRTQLTSAICPTGDQIRGIREVFYQNNPFADNSNPTKAEMDDWHRIAINHVRSLVGYTTEDRKVKQDHCMFARALWGQERKFTTKWDAKYPGVTDSAYGPCTG